LIQVGDWSVVVKGKAVAPKLQCTVNVRARGGSFQNELTKGR